MASAEKSSTNRTLKFDDHCQHVFKRLRSRPDLCDVVLIAGNSGKRISAHRSILIESSDYFAALLSGSMRESKEEEITLSGVDGDVLEILVEFCYTGNLEFREDNIEAILTTADYLQFTEIFEHTSKSAEVSLWTLRLKLEKFPIEAMETICENFDDIANNPQILFLNVEQLIQIITSYDLYVPSEEFLFNVVMKWIDYDPWNRKVHFTSLLSKLRLHLMPPAFLTETVEPLCNSPESLEMVENAAEWNHYRDSPLSNKGSSPRYHKLKSVVKQLVVASDTYPNLVIACYNPHTNKWKKLDTEIGYHGFFVAALKNDELIMVNQLSNQRRRVTRINLVTMASSVDYSLTYVRNNASLVLLSDTIYICGGSDSRGTATKSLAKLYPHSAKWGNVAAMRVERSSPSTVVVNDHLFVSGGIGADGKRLRSVECYDPIKNHWTYIECMQEARSSHGLAAYKGFLLAIAGEGINGDPISTIESYDTDRDRWTAVSSTPTISGYTKCASLGPDLFLFNKGNFYTVTSDKYCENLTLHIIPELDDFYPSRVEMFAIPYEFLNPGSWIRNT